MKTVAPSIRIVVPAYNSADSLPAVLTGIERVLPAASVTVVDDGSTDGTGTVARNAGAQTLVHPRNLGKGAALKTGIRDALRDAGTLAIVTMDADGQHDPAELPRFVEAWEQSRADLIIGDRKIAGSSMPLHRRMSNMITSRLVSVRTGVRIPDSQCGYRLLSRECADRIVPDTDGFEAETEWIIRAVAQGLSVGSLPIRTVYAGENSHMKNWATTKAFVRVLVKEYTWVD